MSLHVYTSKDVAAQALCGFVLRIAAESIAAHQSFSVALSGGSLVQLLEGLKGADTEWDKWHVFFADERVVPLDHDDSNYKAVKETFLSKVPIPGAQVHTITPALSAKDAAADYEKQLVSTLGGKPQIDLVLLGMGPDGHTCSLFPGHALLQERERWVGWLEDAPKPPPARITLTLRSLREARNVAFACIGEGKAAMLQDVFDSAKSRTLPSGIVNSMRPDVHWFTDAAAASLVQPKQEL